jgi:hypothetical protein
MELSEQALAGKSLAELWDLGVQSFAWEATQPAGTTRAELLKKLEHGDCEIYWRNVVSDLKRVREAGSFP